MNKAPWLALAVVCMGALGTTAHASPEGKALYDQHCVACHGAGGAGSFGPPLRNEAQWKALGPQAAAYVAQVAAAGLSGTIEVQGQKYMGLAMPPQSHIPAKDVALIVEYVLGDINGMPAKSTAEDIEQARANPMSHGALRKMRKAQGL